MKILTCDFPKGHWVEGAAISFDARGDRVHLGVKTIYGFRHAETFPNVAQAKRAFTAGYGSKEFRARWKTQEINQ